jgi:hypothetical protein
VCSDQFPSGISYHRITAALFLASPRSTPTRLNSPCCCPDADMGHPVSYTYAFDVMIRHSATYIDRVLRGDLPRNLPVQAPTKYELSVNLGVAKALGLSVPANLMALADHVIE